MNTAAAADLEKYPKYKANYIRAFARMLKNNQDRGVKCSWNTPEEVYKWWLQIEK